MHNIQYIKAEYWFKKKNCCCSWCFQFEKIVKDKIVNKNETKQI